MPTKLQERVEERMQAIGLKAYPLALKAGLGTSFVRDILRGKTATPKADNLNKLARALGTSPEYLLGVSDSPDSQFVDGVDGPVPVLSPRVPYGGEVRAGGFLAVDELAQIEGDHMVPAAVVRNDLYGTAPQFAWKVRGSSMDLAGIHEGMWVIAVPYFDYVERFGDPPNGHAVIAERTRFGGSEIERTVKEVQFGRGGVRLVPRSSDPTHRELFVPYTPDADSDSETIAILAVVVSAVRVYEPPSRVEKNSQSVVR